MEEFYADRRAKYGRQSTCKECYNSAAAEKRRRKRAENPTKTDIMLANAALGVKLCIKCRVTKPRSEFGAHRLTSDGLQSYCRECKAALSRLSRYGMTDDEISQMLADQDSLCASCGIPLDNTSLRIDHDHRCCPSEYTCGNCVRGIICHGCNVALGYINDNPNTALALAAYLISFENIQQTI